MQIFFCESQRRARARAASAVGYGGGAGASGGRGAGPQWRAASMARRSPPRGLKTRPALRPCRIARGICGARLSPRQEHDERLLLADAALVNERYGGRQVDAVDAFFRLLQENCHGRSEMQVLQVKIVPEIELLFLWMPSCQKRATNASNCLAHFHHGRSATHWCQQCLQDKSCKDCGHWRS